jgi:hypothetical protein
VANPPALPSPAARGVDPGPSPVAGAVSLPGSAPGVSSGPVPWDPGTLKPLFEQIIDGAEQSRISGRKDRAAAVGLPDNVVKAATAGAEFPGSAKTALAVSGSNATAKILNSLGVSGKYSDAAIAATAIAAIIIQCKRSDEKFEELIAEYKNSTAAKPAEPAKKP